MIHYVLFWFAAFQIRTDVSGSIDESASAISVAVVGSWSLLFIPLPEEDPPLSLVSQFETNDGTLGSCKLQHIGPTTVTTSWNY